MRTSPDRKPGWLDANILIAATAAALVALRYGFNLYLDLFFSRLWNCLATIGDLLYAISHLVATWTLACLVLRLRRPRPVFRRMIRQPGTTASLAALLVLAIQLVNWGIGFGILKAYTNLEFDRLAASRGTPAAVGLAVAAVWFLQAMTGHCHSEASWIDRMGRALGVFWIATIPFEPFSWYWVE